MCVSAECLTFGLTAYFSSKLDDLLPPQGAWTQDEYLVLTQHGNRLVEYTDGFLEALSLPTDKHQSVLQFLFFAFFHHVGTRGGKVHLAPPQPMSALTSPAVMPARPGVPRPLSGDFALLHLRSEFGFCIVSRSRFRLACARSLSRIW